MELLTSIKLIKKNILISSENRSNMSEDMPTPLLIRHYTRSTLFYIGYTLSNELLSKIGDKCELFVDSLYNDFQSIGFYDKNAECMVLNGEASLLHYKCGSEITMTSFENGQLIQHIMVARSNTNCSDVNRNAPF